MCRSRHIMALFRKAIVGNEDTLVENLDIDSGLWIALQSRRILTDNQLANCKSEVS